MDGNGQHPYEMNLVASVNGDHDGQERVGVEQLRQLVRLLDGSDVAEIEVNRAQAGMKLVLRKVKASEAVAGEVQEILAVGSGSETNGATPAPSDSKHTITAPLVGIFHTSAKPKGKPLINVGDLVKAGQPVGTIQSLNVFNDVESPIAGRVVEIFVQAGQPVEYGQALVVLDSAEEG